MYETEPAQANEYLFMRTSQTTMCHFGGELTRGKIFLKFAFEKILNVPRQPDCRYRLPRERQPEFEATFEPCNRQELYLSAWRQAFRPDTIHPPDELAVSPRFLKTHMAVH